MFFGKENIIKCIKKGKMMVRKLVKKLSACVLAAAVVAGLTGCGSVTSGKRIVRISHAQSETHPEHLGLLAFKKYVEERLGDKYEVQIFPNELLGSAQKAIELTQTGAIDFVVAGTANLETFASVYEIFSMPYLFDSVEDADAMLDGEAGEMLKDILSEYGLHCMGIAENGFRELTNSVREIRSVEDMKNLKIRVAGSNLLMECYKRWGADATNMNWSETYTALQQKTVEGQENPLPAIDAASVQEVQPYCSLWNANYDCLFFCINQKIYDDLTPEQQAVIDECGALATRYEREINRAGDEEIMKRWTEKNGVTITSHEDLDIDSFKTAVDGIDDWFVNELKAQNYEDAEALVAAFRK